MAHVRKQIREAAATLVTGLSTTGARVYQSRVYPLKDADLPCLLVYTEEEEVQGDVSVSTLILDRNMRLTVRGLAKQTANLDDTLDAMLEEVETVLNGATFSGKAKTTVLASARPQEDAIQDKPVGAMEMNFTVNYFTQGNAPGTPI